VSAGDDGVLGGVGVVGGDAGGAPGGVGGAGGVAAACAKAVPDIQTEARVQHAHRALTRSVAVFVLIFISTPIKKRGWRSDNGGCHVVAGPSDVEC
jgi:hypothetical protein